MESIDQLVLASAAEDMPDQLIDRKPSTKGYFIGSNLGWPRPIMLTYEPGIALSLTPSET